MLRSIRTVFGPKFSKQIDQTAQHTDTNYTIEEWYTNSQCAERESNLCQKPPKVVMCWVVMLRSQIIRSSVGLGFEKFGLGSVSGLQNPVSVGFGRFRYGLGLFRVV